MALFALSKKKKSAKRWIKKHKGCSEQARIWLNLNTSLLMYTMCAKGNLRGSDGNAVVEVSSTSKLSPLARAKINAQAWKKRGEQWSKEDAQRH